MKLTKDMQRVVLEQRLGFVATVSPDGAPNLSPKGTTIVWDAEHLMFADIVSPGTVENIRTNPRIEVNVVDPILRKGYRFKGIAVAYASGPMFDHGLHLLHALGSTLGPDRVRSIVVIEVTRSSDARLPGLRRRRFRGCDRRSLAGAPHRPPRRPRLIVRLPYGCGRAVSGGRARRGRGVGGDGVQWR